MIFLPGFPPLAAALTIAVWAAALGLDPGQTRVAYAFAGILAVVGIAILLARLVMRGSTQFAVTNQRIVVKRGLLAVHTIEMNIDKVESVDVDQSLLGRMLDFGTVTVHGTGARWDPIGLLADPLRFRNAITSHGQGLGPRVAAMTPGAAVDRDLAFWDAMADKNDGDLLEEYLIRFPQGRFANLARTKLARRPPQP